MSQLKRFTRLDFPEGGKWPASRTALYAYSTGDSCVCPTEAREDVRQMGLKKIEKLEKEGMFSEDEKRWLQLYRDGKKDTDEFYVLDRDLLLPLHIGHLVNMLRQSNDELKSTREMLKVALGEIARLQKVEEAFARIIVSSMDSKEPENTELPV
jgi:hypothetical protein